jgi:hypothetical protein
LSIKVSRASDHDVKRGRHRLTRELATTYIGIAMQRPPDRKSPQVLFSRAGNEWINRVAQALKQFERLAPSAEEKAELERWAETEFICSTLRRGEVRATREQVARMVAAGPDYVSGITEPDLTVSAHLHAVRRVWEAVKAGGRAALITPEMLVILNEAFAHETGFRKSPGDTTRPLKPVPAERLPAAVESACRWCAAESFAELNPVEQAAIVLLRLLEIQPFEQANTQTALLAASLFTLRSEMPPVIIRPEHDRAFLSALEEGGRTNTKPMVELIAAAAETTLGEMMGVIESRRRQAEGRKG